MYQKSIAPNFEMVGKRKKMTGVIGELSDGHTIIHSMEYDNYHAAEVALDALAFELLTDMAEQGLIDELPTFDPTTCVFCHKPHHPQHCSEKNALLFAPDGERNVPDAYTLAAEAGAFGPTHEQTVALRQIVMDDCRREVSALPLDELRARYLASTGELKPPRGMKAGDYIEMEVLHALNVHMAGEFTPLDCEFAAAEYAEPDYDDSNDLIEAMADEDLAEAIWESTQGTYNGKVPADFIPLDVDFVSVGPDV